MCVIRFLPKRASTSGVSTKIAPSLAKTTLTTLPNITRNTKNFQVLMGCVRGVMSEARCVKNPRFSKERLSRIRPMSASVLGLVISHTSNILSKFTAPKI